MYMAAKILGPHEGKYLNVIGDQQWIKLRGKDTNGAYAMNDWAMLTVCSTSSKVPGKREAKKSGSRLMVQWAMGQYHRATKQYSGNFLG
jgi:hypothetical protein